MHLRVCEDSILSVQFLIQLLSFLHVLLIRSTRDVIIRLFSGEIQHQRVRLVSDGDGAGPLGPGLPVHLHRHHRALQDQLRSGNKAFIRKEPVPTQFRKVFPNYLSQSFNPP